MNKTPSFNLRVPFKTIARNLGASPADLAYLITIAAAHSDDPKVYMQQVAASVEAIGASLEAEAQEAEAAVQRLSVKTKSQPRVATKGKGKGKGKGKAKAKAEAPVKGKAKTKPGTTRKAKVTKA